MSVQYDTEGHPGFSKLVETTLSLQIALSELPMVLGALRLTTRKSKGATILDCRTLAKYTTLRY